MSTVDIGIGHDDNLVVAQLLQIYGFRIFLRSNRNSQGLKDHLDFFTFKYPMHHGFLHVQNLSAQRQNRLKTPVPSLFSRSTRRVSLYQKNLTLCRIVIRTVSQLTRQSGSAQYRFTLYQLPGFPGSMTGRSSKDHFIHNGFCLLGMLLQIILQCRSNRLCNRCSNLRIPQLGLRLSFKLRFGHLYRNDCRQTFPKIIAVDIEFQFRKHSVFFGIRLQSSRQSTLKAGQMRTAFDGIDIIDI